MKAREQANWHTIAGAAVIAATTGIIGFFVGLSQAKTTTVEVIKEVPVIKEVVKEVPRSLDPEAAAESLRRMAEFMLRVRHMGNRGLSAVPGDASMILDWDDNTESWGIKW